jgi:hypothetical protein
MSRSYTSPPPCASMACRGTALLLLVVLLPALWHIYQRLVLIPRDDFSVSAISCHILWVTRRITEKTNRNVAGRARRQTSLHSTTKDLPGPLGSNNANFRRYHHLQRTCRVQISQFVWQRSARAEILEFYPVRPKDHLVRPSRKSEV